MKAHPITQQRLQELLHYNPATGVFTWLVNRGPRRVGERAGTISNQGYWQLALDRMTWQL